MIRCLAGGFPGHLVRAYPCTIHRTDKRDKRIALAVIKRDGKCWNCGSTDRLEAGHIVPKQFGGADSMENMRAECFSLNRTGRCK